MKLGIGIGIGYQNGGPAVDPTGPTITAPGSLDVSTYKIGTAHTITSGTATPSGGGTVSYEYRWLVAGLSVASVAGYTPVSGDDTKSIAAQWLAVETGGTNAGATAWQTVGSGTVTYVAPTFSSQPSMAPDQAEPTETFTITPGVSSVTATQTVEYLTIGGVDDTGNLSGTSYTPTVEGSIAYRERLTNSGGTVLSDIITALSNVLPVITIDSLDEETGAVAVSVSEAGTAYALIDQNSSRTYAQVEAAGNSFAVTESGGSYEYDTSAFDGSGYYLHVAMVDSQSGESVVDTTGPYTFTIPDVTAPTISSSSPTDNATDVAITVNPTITFTENVVFGSGNITLRDNDGGWADLEVFDVTSDIGGGAGTVSISGDTLTIEPTADLDNSIEYAIRIDATAIDDTSGNSFAGVANDTTLSFTTVAASAGLVVNEGSSTASFSSSGGYRIATLTNGQTLVVSGEGKPAGLLMVAGGGGGGGRKGGGGGAGEVISRADAACPTLTVTTHTATVGTGGSGGNNSSAGSNGGDTTFAGLTAIGGGEGGRLTATDGVAGGSGGGGAAAPGGTGGETGGTSLASDGVGNAGGAGSASQSGAGGGGGAAGVGSAGVDSSGAGGPGLSSPVPGEGGTYGVGGSGWTGPNPGVAGTDGTGNGGEGGNDTSGQRTGGVGGKGIVKVWWTE